MTSSAAVRIEHIAFLTPGNFVPEAPSEGLHQALDLLVYGEQLGYNSAWVRQRHLEPGIAAAAVFLGAASQRTRRIELGSAVIQLGYENPFRLAEDLSLLDVLAGGRLHVGVSVGPPPYGGLLGRRLFDSDPASIDFSHARALRLADNLRGDWLDEQAIVPNAAGLHRPRLQPFAAGLIDRLWYGAGSLHSAQWAAEHGFNLLTGNVNRVEHSETFTAIQLSQIARFRQHWQLPRPPRIALGRVVVPLDSADAATRQLYLDYAASRQARTLAPQGERRTMFAPDLVGYSDDILRRLLDDPVLPEVREFRLELPYEFSYAQYRQILDDFIHRIAPQLDWKPDHEHPPRLP